MMINKFRIRHWNCSKFANYIRGTDKPYALEWNEWDTWHKTAQKKHPIRYYIAENFLKTLQHILYYPADLVYSIRRYISNRFIDKTHLIQTNLDKGYFHDIDEKILHGCFNELVKFVDVECAWIHGTYPENKKKYKFKNGSCKQAGLDYLDWASKDKSKNRLTNFAKTSKEIKKLYVWWTEKRPKRQEDYSNKYYGEDTKMLLELISLRESLWT